MIRNAGQPVSGRTLRYWGKMEVLQKLEDRSYRSYKARMFASRRLALRGKAWNASLLSLTLATTIASVGLLTQEDMYGTAGPTIFVCLSVLSLVTSLVVAGQNYGGRSRDLFDNYRRIQRLSTEAEYLRLTGSTTSPEEVRGLLKRYNDLLDDSENHSEVDYERTLDSNEQHMWLIRKDRIISLMPFAALCIPFCVLIPFFSWVLNAI